MYKTNNIDNYPSFTYLDEFNDNINDKKLIYDDTINTDNIQNILLICSNTYDAQIFYDSANSATFPILYSYTSEKKEMLALFKAKFQHGIKRVAIVFQDPCNECVLFLDNALFFEEEDLLENQITFSENVQFLISIVDFFKIDNLDFLACNTLQYSKWSKYYELLNKTTTIICGASIDETGNDLNGSNWVMENTNEHIRDVYFTELINNYTSSLAVTQLNQAGGTIQFRQTNNTLEYQQQEGSWTSVTNYPINITNTTTNKDILTISLITDLSLNSSAEYFICNSSYITFNGLNNTVSFNGINMYPGLINNGSSVSYGYHTISVQNIKTASVSSTLIFGGGWLCQIYFGRNSKNIGGFNSNINTNLISNCSNSGSINGTSSGGICGQYAGYTSELSISNCFNTGSITCVNGGGICGQYAGSYGGSISISYCSNTGLIAGLSSGGICGQYAGSYGGSTSITNCSNTGSILGVSGGGICGHYAGSNIGSTAISYCSNIGSILGVSGGGICGQSAGLNGGFLTISNCSNTGSITSNLAGGICGSHAGNNTGTVSISNSSNSGLVSCLNGGGICGQYAGYNSLLISISNCSNSGLVSSLNGGGICGQYAGYNSLLTISNCSNTNSITGGSAGGICGQFAGYYIGSKLSIYNCFNTGSISGSNAGGIVGQKFGCSIIDSIIENCYSTCNIMGLYAGGICGSLIGNGVIQNCYFIGAISNSCGGILGGGVLSPNPRDLIIQNCYVYCTVVNIGSEIKAITVKFTFTIKNCYIAAYNNWSDITANSILTGTPASSIVGIVWSSESKTPIITTINTPYLLTSYLKPPDVSLVYVSDEDYNIIYITGERFTNVKSVTFNGTDILPTTFVIVNDTMIIVTILSLSKNYNIFNVCVTNVYDYTNTYFLQNSLIGNIHFTEATDVDIFKTYTSDENKLTYENVAVILGLNFTSVTRLFLNNTEFLRKAFEIISNSKIIVHMFYTHADFAYIFNVSVRDKHDNGILYVKQNPEILLSNICFPANTLISTNQGKVPIDKINPIIHTIRNKKIVTITKTTSPDKYLVCFEKDSLGKNIPSETTIITENHKIFYKGQMLKAKLFIDKFVTVYKIKYTGELLYNVLMEDYDKMMVNNLICETLSPTNNIAQIYKQLQTLTYSDQIILIKTYNDYVVENNIFSS